MKKNDIILIVVILAITAGFFYVVQRNKNTGEPDWVVVTVGSAEYGRYELDKDAVYEIEAHEGHMNILEIKDGVADMTDANCSDQLCVYQKSISKQGEMIVCLPHEVIVSVEASEESTSDAVAN